MPDTTQALTQQSCSGVCLGHQDTGRRMGQAALKGDPETRQTIIHKRWFTHQVEFYTVMKMKQVRMGACHTNAVFDAAWFYTMWFHCIKSSNRD